MKPYTQSITAFPFFNEYFALFPENKFTLGNAAAQMTPCRFRPSSSWYGLVCLKPNPAALSDCMVSKLPCQHHLCMSSLLASHT